MVQLLAQAQRPPIVSNLHISLLYNLRYVMSTSGINQHKHQNMGKNFSANEQTMLDTFHRLVKLKRIKQMEGIMKIVDLLRFSQR